MVGEEGQSCSGEEMVSSETKHGDAAALLCFALLRFASLEVERGP